jgi:hypothetical protein
VTTGKDPIDLFAADGFLVLDGFGVAGVGSDGFGVNSPLLILARNDGSLIPFLGENGPFGANNTPKSLPSGSSFASDINNNICLNDFITFSLIQVFFQLRFQSRK